MSELSIEKMHYLSSIELDKEVVWQQYYEVNRTKSNGWEELNIRNWLLSICSKLSEMQSELLSCQ